MIAKIRSFVRKLWRPVFFVGLALYVVAMIWFFFAPLPEERLTAEPWCNLIFSEWEFEGNGRFQYNSRDFSNDFCAVGASYSGHWLQDDNIVNVQIDSGLPVGGRKWRLRGLAGGRLLFVLAPDNESALLYRCDKGY